MTASTGPRILTTSLSSPSLVQKKKNGTSDAARGTRETQTYMPIGTVHVEQVEATSTMLCM